MSDEVSGKIFWPLYVLLSSSIHNLLEDSLGYRLTCACLLRTSTQRGCNEQSAVTFIFPEIMVVGERHPPVESRSDPGSTLLNLLSVGANFGSALPKKYFTCLLRSDRESCYKFFECGSLMFNPMVLVFSFTFHFHPFT